MLGGGPFLPAAADRDDGVGVVLGDVVQMVGDRAADVFGRVVPQPLDERQRRPRVGLERLQAHAPGQARPRAFRDQPAHMFVGIVGPAAQRRQREIRVRDQEWPDRELGRKQRRQPLERRQRRHRMVKPVEAEEVGHRPRRKLGKHGIVRRRWPVPRGPQDHRQGRRIVGRQMGAQRRRDMHDARLQRQPTEPAPAGRGETRWRRTGARPARTPPRCARPPAGRGHLSRGWGNASTSNSCGSRRQDGGLAGLPPKVIVYRSSAAKMQPIGMA